MLKIIDHQIKPESSSGSFWLFEGVLPLEGKSLRELVAEKVQRRLDYA